MKPVVIFAPEEGREVLRSNGVLPRDWFHSFASFGEEVGDLPLDDEPSFTFWPHQFSYRLPEEPEPDRAPDLAEFLGVPPARDEATKRRHERDVVAAFLRAVTMHVVVLDGNEKTGTNYLRFRSCSEIVAWGRAFSQSLHMRFDGEETLQGREGILVVVAKGEQVKASQEELDAFGRMIAEGSVFNACYVIDYSTKLGKAGRPFHAWDVWDIHVARLLLSFVLNQEQGRPIVRAGRSVRIWQAAECELPLDATACTRAVNKALEVCSQTIDGKLGKQDDVSARHGAGFDAERLMAAALDDPLKPETAKSRRHGPSWWFVGWSSFDVQAFCREICDPSRWRTSLENAGKSFAKWCRESFPRFRRSQARQIFDRVHANPRVLNGQIASLDEELSSERSALGGTDKPLSEVLSLEDEWSALVDCERERQEILADLKIPNESSEADDGPESLASAVCAAQDHYVGLAYGSLALLAVALASGVILRQVLFALCGATVEATAVAMVLSLSVAAGGLFMLLLTLGLQRASGDRAVRKLVARSAEADRKMIEKDRKSRTLASKARAYSYFLCRKLFLERVRALLERIRCVVQHEICPETVSVTMDLWREETVPGNETDARRLFLAATVEKFAQLGVPADDAEVNKRVADLTEEWWGAAASPKHPTFVSLWKDLGRRYDERRVGNERVVAGCFPAAAYAFELQNFVGRFLREVVAETRQLVLERALRRKESLDSEEMSVKDALDSWCRRWHADESVSYATATWRELDTFDFRQFVFVPWDPGREAQRQLAGPVNPESLQTSLAMSENQNGAVEVLGSKLINKVRAFAFFYQEFDVRLCSSEKGVLVFRGWGED